MTSRHEKRAYVQSVNLLLVILVFCGVATLMLGGAMATLPGREGLAAMVGSSGLLVASVALVLRRKPIVELGPTLHKVRRFFNCVFICIFLVGIVCAAKGAISDLYYCSRSAGKFHISSVQVMYRGLSATSGVTEQISIADGNRRERCLFGLAELNVALAFTISLIAIVRSLNMRVTNS
jgi:hypothetical protein